MRLPGFHEDHLHVDLTGPRSPFPLVRWHQNWRYAQSTQVRALTGCRLGLPWPPSQSRLWITRALAGRGARFQEDRDPRLCLRPRSRGASSGVRSGVGLPLGQRRRPWQFRFSDRLVLRGYLALLGRRRERTIGQGCPASSYSRCWCKEVTS